MKNVLIIIGKLLIGGAEKIGRDIGYYADKEKYNIHYLVFTDEIGAYEAELEAAGCQIHHMDPPSAGYIKYCKNLFQLLKKEHIDVIHSHTMFNSGWIMMIGKLLGVPVRISHSHSIKGPEHRRFLKNTYENIMRVCINTCSTHLVACGKSAGKWLYGEKQFNKKGIVIYNGIDLEKYAFSEITRNEIRKAYKWEDSYVIGHVGHFMEVKNQVFLIELLPRILTLKPNAMIVFLGDGQDRGMLTAKAENLGVRDQIVFTGNVSNVGEFMNGMDVFAFPSLYEGMPLSLIEAQTNGLPCIISERIPDDVHLTNLVKPLSLENTDEWLTAIVNAQRIHSESYYQVMSDMGFDTSGMTTKLYELYEG